MEQDLFQWGSGAHRVFPLSVSLVDMLQHVLKLSTGYAGSGVSQEVQAKVNGCLCYAQGCPT